MSRNVQQHGQPGCNSGLQRSRLQGRTLVGRVNAASCPLRKLQELMLAAPSLPTGLQADKICWETACILQGRLMGSNEALAWMFTTRRRPEQLQEQQ